jgi:hypothetical protein
MVMSGEVIHKLDHIATIYINNRYYFNVFRRYNSPYNIVVEDNNDDIHLHQDYTVRTSLKTILCLSDSLANNIYTVNATSIKHNGDVPIGRDILDMRWTDIHTQYVAITVNFGGIFYMNNLTTDQNQPIHYVTHTTSDIEAANTLLTLNVPKMHNTRSSLKNEANYTTLRSGTRILKTHM